MDVLLTSWSEITEVEPLPGVRLRLLFGHGVNLSRVELEPGAVVPLHSHPQEQLGFVLSGEIVMTIAGKETRMRADDAYVIPGGVEHMGVGGPEGCVVLDVFHPVREDYRKLVEEAERASA